MMNEEHDRSSVKLKVVEQIFNNRGSNYSNQKNYHDPYYHRTSVSRFVIVDEEGKLVDDCQGLGFRTETAARRFIWYAFNGGKQWIENKIKNHSDYKRLTPSIPSRQSNHLFA